MNVPNVYLDASALVKRHVAETGTREVEQLVAHAGSLATLAWRLNPRDGGESLPTQLSDRNWRSPWRPA